MAAIDTANALATLGSEGALGNVVVPSNVSSIKEIIACASTDGAAVGSSTFFLRLRGNGLRDGQQAIAVGAIGGTLATTGIAAGVPIVVPVDIPVIPGNQITLEGEMAGADSGTARMIATLVFQ